MGIKKLERILAGTINDFLVRDLPLRRIVLVASILKYCGSGLDVERELLFRIKREQNDDGGWIDCEDTAWISYFLSGRKEVDGLYKRGLAWLLAERFAGKGWGFCKRDRSCIPITAQVLFLLPEITCFEEAFSWLEGEWTRDLASTVQLNYKGAFYILACISAYHRKQSFSLQLFQETIEYLISQQRADGSWGPWRTHPAPRECFITGVCLAAISASLKLFRDKRLIPTIEKACDWNKKNQLDSGFFPTHFIDEGSGWVLFGWKEAIVALSEI